MMLERRVEGIIHASMYHRAVEPPADSREVPTVLLNCYSEDGLWASVVPDEVSGGHRATEVLLDKGHERVGFINLDPILPAANGCIRGYKQALGARELPFDDSLVTNGDGTASGGYRLAAGLMRMPNPRRLSSAATTRRPWGLRGAQGTWPTNPRGRRGRRLRQPGAYRRPPQARPLHRRAAAPRDGPLGGQPPHRSGRARQPDAGPTRDRLPLHRTRIGLIATRGIRNWVC